MVTRQRRTVLCTWEVGGELGHISRLSAIAKTLEKAGYRVVVALKDLSRAYPFFSGTGVTLMQAPVWLPKISMQRPIACQADSMLLLGYLEPDPLECQMLAWRALVDAVEPGLLVFDFSPTAMLAMRDYPIPKVVVGTGFAEPAPGAPLADWRPAPQNDGLVARQEQRVLGVINQVLQRRGETLLTCLTDLFCADLTVISNLRELDFYPQRPATRYCLAATPGTERHLTFAAADKPRLVAYLKPAYPGFAQVLAALTQVEAEVIAICPTAPAGSLESWQRPNVQFTRDLVNLPALLAQADLFVGHGNAGTVRESLVAGAPVLVLPIQLEQLLTGKKLQALGVGVLLEGEPDGAAIVSAIRQMLRQKEVYRGAIDRLLAGYDRPHLAMPDLVREFCAEHFSEARAQ